MGQVTVFSGPERRRRWSHEERLQILTEAFSPGACVADVCRRHDISTSLIYTWRGKLGASASRTTPLNGLCAACHSAGRRGCSAVPTVAANAPPSFTRSSRPHGWAMSIRRPG